MEKEITKKLRGTYSLKGKPHGHMTTITKSFCIFITWHRKVQVFREKAAIYGGGGGGGGGGRGAREENYDIETEGEREGEESPSYGNHRTYEGMLARSASGISDRKHVPSFVGNIIHVDGPDPGEIPWCRDDKIRNGCLVELNEFRIVRRISLPAETHQLLLQLLVRSYHFFRGRINQHCSPPFPTGLINKLDHAALEHPHARHLPHETGIEIKERKIN